MPLSNAEVERMVDRYIARLRVQVPLEAVYVYGSYVRGTPRDDSDIDVAVVSPAFGHDRHGELVLLSRTRRPDAILIEALPFTSEEYHNLPPGSFLREVIKHGWRIV